VSVPIETISLVEWRQKKEDDLRSDNGWLTLAGLFVLNTGQNKVGTRPTDDVALPAGSVPEELGVIDFDSGIATLHVTSKEPVFVDGSPATPAILKDDADKDGPTLVTINAITFFVIKRGDNYAIRVRDRNNPARLTFTGRQWFSEDPAYRVGAFYADYEVPRRVQIVTSTGLLTPMDIIGYVDFELDGVPLRLQAFSEDEGELWFIFKDQTSGTLTYGAGRFLKATLTENRVIDLNFNRAYSPPCAFTPYAICPIAPKENVLPVRIPAGEKALFE